jgi:ubiquinone/menaquinone biosynthesis C-methylase UbiE
MTEHRLHLPTNRHDYIPAFGHDLLLPGYDLMTRLFGMGRVYRTLITQAEIGAGDRVLEIGCGTGNLTTRAQRSSPASEVIGTDPDPLALARAQRKARGLIGIRFERAYAQQLPFGDGEFDRALSSMMLHHLDEATKAAAVGELFRVLRPGGRLHIVDIRGETMPKLLETAGFQATVAGVQPHRLIGPLTYYRATRPD